MKKQTLIFILTIFLTISVLAGCGNYKLSMSSGSNSSSDTASGSRTITDSAGRIVEVPSNVERIVALGNTPRMITYLGLADKVAGLGGMDPEQITPVTAYAYANKDLWAKLPIVGTDAAGATNYYPEEIIAVNPDVVLCSYTKELGDEIQAKTGIPVVVVPIGTLFGKDYEEALRLIGDVCGVEDQAEEVIAFIDDCLKDLRTRTSSISATGKPTVLGAAATFKGMHGIEGVYTKYAVFEAISANDVTKGISEKASAVLIDKEQVIEWNPQFIFLDSGGVNLVKKDYQENSNLYGHLRAVAEGNIYQYPSSNSYYSNVEIPIVNSYYVASIIFPEEFKDINFKEKANDIFNFFLGTDDYLSKLEAAGAGYGKVTLGEN